jgi:uncharacterized membrane protein
MKKLTWMQTFKRLCVHSWFDIGDAKRAVPHALQQKLQAQIKASEALHSGQIRLVVEAALPLSYIWRGLAVRARAVMLFGKLRVWDTERNNGVLIYLLLAERKIEIVADRGLEQLVAKTVWVATINRMRSYLKSKQFEVGLALAVEDVSKLLIAHFPDTAGSSAHANELPDAPIIQ